jgi:MFS family permease
MSMVILGGVGLQWPLGWLSDRFDRRWVITGSFIAALFICIMIAATGRPGGVLLLLGALFGGVSFALYPLCVAHTNDRLSADERVGASGGLVLSYSVGAAIGPLGGAAAMAIWGSAGLFIFIGACAMAAAGLALWRQRAGPAIANADQHSFQILPRTTPMAAALDPQASSPD